MQAEIVAIGSELLSGSTVNTNATFLSLKLSEIGIHVVRHTAVGDKEEEIYEVLKEALARSDIVITTGGLGPTLDDITRSVAAKLMQSSISFNEEVAQHLKKRYGESLLSLKDQSTIPVKAKPLMNDVGTAPGLVFDQNEKVLALLPGVPVEFKPMLTDKLVPYFKERFPQIKSFSTTTLHFHALRESDIDPELRILQKQYPDLLFGIYPQLGLVTVRLTGNAKGAAEQLRKKFAEHLYDSPSGTIQEAVYLRFVEQGMTLSIAESCTGGAIAACLTQVSGASKYFLGSLVAYSNKLKTTLLSVPEKTLLDHGAVSAEVVEAMVTGLIAKTGSDYGIAVTGIAGPTGGTPEKPVGTIWCAIAKKGEKPLVWSLNLKGNRESIIMRTVHLVLGKLIQIT